MTYAELHKATNLGRVFAESGFNIAPNREGSIALSADANHEKQKAFCFCEDNTLGIFETIEEAVAFVRGWNECRSMMKLSGRAEARAEK